MQLRKYQNDIIEKARQLMQQGIHSLLIQSPTGSGKTLLTAFMLKTAAERGLSSWFVVHRRELVTQSSIAFYSIELPHGIIANGFEPQHSPLVQIASIYTLVNRLKEYPEPKLIIWDECHHVAANTWSIIFKQFPKAFHIGLTATPERLDGKGLGEFFKEMINGPSVQELIDQGFLAPYRIYAPPNSVDMAQAKISRGDYSVEEMTEQVDKKSITGSAIEHYQRYAPGKRAVVFCFCVEHSLHVVKQFREAGIKTEHIDARTSTAERDRKLNQFRDNEIQVLCNVDLFGEGFDLPSLEVAILLRPTQSLALFLQQCGRALRPSPGKTEALILDHVGNWKRHGLPCDVREWSLEGRKKKETGPATKQCPKCFAINPAKFLVCQFCGTPLKNSEGGGPRQVGQVEGELVEIDKTEIKSNRAFAKEAARRKRVKEEVEAKTLPDLIALGKARGYQYPEGWAKHKLRTRNAKQRNTNA